MNRINISLINTHSINLIWEMQWCYRPTGNNLPTLSIWLFPVWTPHFKIGNPYFPVYEWSALKSGSMSKSFL